MSLGFSLFYFNILHPKRYWYMCALGHMSHSFDKESKDILTLVISLSFTNCLWLDLIPTLSAWLNRLCTYDMCIFFSELIYFYFQLVSGRRESYLSLWSKYLDSRFFVPFQYWLLPWTSYTLKDPVANDQRCIFIPRSKGMLEDSKMKGWMGGLLMINGGFLAKVYLLELLSTLVKDNFITEEAVESVHTWIKSGQIIIYLAL